MDNEMLKWIRTELRRRNREEAHWHTRITRLPAPAACRRMLAPSSQFSNEYYSEETGPTNKTGPRSSVIADLLIGCCAGWRIKPTSAELFEAMRAEEPTPRELAIAGVLINEATLDQVLLAYWEKAFTWRQLVRAMHRQGTFRAELGRYVQLHGHRE